ncbi:MAG: hypothetical protein ICV62_18540, partial [Cyanobacteria bacterium Co-bin13]|nr:hypothetical protein [Cyanobacteria bacterium Co-bin13]
MSRSSIPKQVFMPFLKGRVFRKICCSSAVLGMAVGLVQLSALARQTDSPPADNIYHETENLPDDADIFPRMGKIEGAAGERTN